MWITFFGIVKMSVDGWGGDNPPPEIHVPHLYTLLTTFLPHIPPPDI
jgi:hypothetical protein